MKFMKQQVSDQVWQYGIFTLLFVVEKLYCQEIQ